MTTFESLDKVRGYVSCKLTKIEFSSISPAWILLLLELLLLYFDIKFFSNVGPSMMIFMDQFFGKKKVKCLVEIRTTDH